MYSKLLVFHVLEFTTSNAKKLSLLLLVLLASAALANLLILLCITLAVTALRANQCESPACEMRGLHLAEFALFY